VLKVVKETPKATFLFLTKNPARYLEFNFPNNVILGATIETNNKNTCTFLRICSSRLEH